MSKVVYLPNPKGDQETHGRPKDLGDYVTIGTDNVIRVDIPEGFSSELTPQAALGLGLMFIQAASYVQVVESVREGEDGR